MTEIIITSSVLIAAVMLLRLLFRGRVSQRLIYAAWLLVALRLLVPIQFGSFDFSILSRTETVTEALSEAAKDPISGPSRDEVYQSIVQDYIDRGESIFIPEVQEKLDSEDASYEDILQSYPQQEILLPEVDTKIEKEVADSITAPTVGQVLTGIWIAGMAAMAVWFLSVNLAFRRLLRRTAKPMDLSGCPVPVKAAPGLPSPCLFGFLAPTVYLTPGCTEDETRLRHVLTHELTHYAHFDHIWSTVRCACLCIHWFNPLVWIAAHLAKRDCELACDEAAVQKLGEAERIAYGRTLVDMVASSASAAHLLDTATAMYESKHALKERVNRIVKQHKHLLISALSLILVLLVVACFAFAGSDPTPSPPDPTPTTTAPATTAPPATSAPPSRQELEAAGHAIGDAISSLHQRAESDFADPAEYQRVQSLLDNIVGWSSDSSKTVSVNLMRLTDESIALFRKYVVDAPYLVFVDFSGNSSLDPDPVFDTDAPYETVSNPSEGLQFRLSTDGTYYMVSGIGTCADTEIIIPSEHDGLPVRAIRHWAFADQYAITSVTIPDSVFLIQSGAFHQCTGLTEVILPDSLRSIGSRAFEGCTGLTGVTIPGSVTTIGEYAFMQTSLTEVTIPDSITVLSGAIFYQCAKLTSVTLPVTLNEIGNSAFSECTSLTQIMIPRSVTTIGMAAFSLCSGLQEIAIPEGVTTLGSHAFGACSSLSSVTLPATLRTIGEGVFTRCDGLTDIRYSGTVHQWETVMKDGEWIDDSENHTVRCTDGNAVHVSYDDALTSYAEASGLSYAEWFYRYCAALDLHLDVCHSLCEYATIYQYADEAGALWIAHTCADGTFTDIPFDAAAGDLEGSDIWHWFFAEDFAAGYINGHADHMVNAFFADPLEFVTALAKEKPTEIDLTVYNMRIGLGTRNADAAAICESLLETVTDRSVKDTLKLMLDLFT